MEEDDTNNKFNFTVQTKYFNADIQLNHFSHSQLSEVDPEPCLSSTEALLLYCEGTKDSFQRAEKVWSRVKEFSPAVCLCIVDSTKDKAESETELTRTDIMSWCLSNQFELVECDEVVEEAVGDIEDKVGKDRILEALRSHTWSSMELLPPQTNDTQKGQK